MNIKLCKDCEYFTSCKKEFWINEFTEQQGVLGCMKGEENVPKVDENMREIFIGE